VAGDDSQKRGAFVPIIFDRASRKAAEMVIERLFKPEDCKQEDRPKAV